ncbi:MAG: polyprenol monophosphomannose synthase [Pseudonocardia sp.]|nr:polyprenol monophosphomannose synthase [Pseudonocardia sp.]
MTDLRTEPDTWSLVVIIPTYNEVDNLVAITTRVRAAMPSADILVVDDASPDGTGWLAERLTAQDSRVHVLHRQGKAGLGAAYLAGFDWVLARGYDVVVQMDADGSHPPESLPGMVAGLSSADLVIGSRYVPGGSVVNWPKHRELLSRGGNLYSRIALGVQIHDITAGYRVFRRDVLENLTLDEVSSQGYCFQIDMVMRVLRAGFRAAEFPITFTEREHGTSKMSGAIVREALWRVTRWGLSGRFRRPVRGEHGHSRARPSQAPSAHHALFERRP